MKETTWRVLGMHCPGCEAALLRAVRDIKGIKNPRADYRAGTLIALWDDTVLTEAALRDRVAEAGYTLAGQRRAITIGKRLLALLVVLAVLASLFALVSLSPLRGLLSRFPTAKAGMGLGALFAVGLLTSLHCVAMCGGINLAQSAASAQAGRRVSASNIRYNLGRLASYTLLGGIIGAVGSVFSLSNAAQAAIQLVAAAFMVLMALNLLDIGGLRGVVPTLPAGLRSNRCMDRSGHAQSHGCLLLQRLFPGYDRPRASKSFLCHLGGKGQSREEIPPHVLFSDAASCFVSFRPGRWGITGSLIPSNYCPSRFRASNAASWPYSAAS